MLNYQRVNKEKDVEKPWFPYENRLRFSWIFHMELLVYCLQGQQRTTKDVGRSPQVL